MNIDVEKVAREIERLQSISAELACAEDVAKYKAKVEAEFEEQRQGRIHDLKATLEIAKEFEVVAEEQHEELTENVETQNITE